MVRRTILSTLAALAAVLFTLSPASAYTDDGMVLYIDARNTDSFDPGVPSIVRDISPTGLTGSIFGGVTFDASNGEWDFTGGGPASSHIDMGTINSDFTSGLTIEFVADFGASNAWERIIDWGNTLETNNIIVSRFSDSGQLMFEVWRGGSGQGRLVTYGQEIVENQSSHWAVTLESDGTAHIYKDGAEVATSLNGSDYVSGAPYGAFPESGPRTFGYIGRSLWNDPEFGGSLTLLRVYDRALSPDEVLDNFLYDDSTAEQRDDAGQSGSTESLATTGVETITPWLVGMSLLAAGSVIRRRRFHH